MGDYGWKNRSVRSLLGLASLRVHRLAARFAELAAKVRDGRLPVRRTARRRADRAPAPAGPPAAAAEASPAVPSPSMPGPSMPEQPRLPRGVGWLLQLTPGDHHVRGRREQVEYWLADPELPAVLEAAPETRRILRSLCWTLGIPLPPILHLPPREKRTPPAAAPRFPRRRPPGQARGQAPSGRAQAQDQFVGPVRPSWPGCRTRSWTEGWPRPGLASRLFRSRIGLSRTERADVRP